MQRLHITYTNVSDPNFSNEKVRGCISCQILKFSFCWPAYFEAWYGTLTWCFMSSDPCKTVRKVSLEKAPIYFFHQVRATCVDAAAVFYGMLMEIYC